MWRAAVSAYERHLIVIITIVIVLVVVLVLDLVGSFDLSAGLLTRGTDQREEPNTTFIRGRLRFVTLREAALTQLYHGALLHHADRLADSEAGAFFNVLRFADSSQGASVP